MRLTKLVGILMVFMLIEGCGRREQQTRFVQAPPPDVIQPPPACQADAAPVSFTRDIKPLLDTACVQCHAFPENYGDYEVAKRNIDGFINRINLSTDDVKKMPPPPADLSFEERKLFEDWKNQGLLLDADGCDQPGNYEDGQISLADVEYYVLNDLNQLDSDDKANTRYLSLAHIYNMQQLGVVTAPMELYKNSINKTLNSLSNEDEVVKATAIDPLGILYRFDLRSYGLTAADWDDVLQSEQINFISNTDEGVIIRDLTGTTQPWLRADNFLFTSLTDGPLHYRLTRTPDTLDALAAKLGLNIQEAFDNNEVICAGFTGSEISTDNKNRLICRFETRDGMAWLTYDPVDLDGVAQRNLFNFPLIAEARPQNAADAFDFAASEIIYDKENGMHGYALFNADGLIQNEAPIDIVRDPRNPHFSEIVNAVSCHRCHEAGLIPKADQILAHVTANGDQFDPLDRDRVVELFPSQTALFANYTRDNATYARALQEVGYGVEAGVGPVTLSTDTFLNDVNADTLAAELLLSKEEFNTLLNQSSAVQAQIGQLSSGGLINRQQFFAVIADIIRDFRLGEEPLDR